MRRMKWLGAVEIRGVVTITMRDMYDPRPASRPDVSISLLTSESGIPADPLTIVLRWDFGTRRGWRSNRYPKLTPRRNPYGYP
jgi:hypothetical protein